MLYMISYDLMTPGKDYAKLDSYIKSAGGREVLRSQWLIVSTLTANEIWADLKGRVDQNDRLFVTELTQNMEWSAGKLMLTDAEVQALWNEART